MRQDIPSSNHLYAPPAVTDLGEGTLVITSILVFQSRWLKKLGISDTLRRHVQRRHKINEPLKRAVRACDSCRSCKTRCDGGVPCDECLRRKIRCSLHESVGSVKKQRPEASAHREAGLGHDQPQSHHSKKENQYIDLYFQSFHPSWCFIHKGSFDVRHETPLLVQSMTVLGLWASGEQSAQSSAIELHATLDLAIQNQKVPISKCPAQYPNSTNPYVIGQMGLLKG